MRIVDVEPIIRDLTAMKTELGFDALLIDAMIEGLESQPVVGIDDSVKRSNNDRENAGSGQSMTVADRIRSMADEELAEWLFEFDSEAVAIGLMQMEQGLMTKEQRLAWLRLPAALEDKP